MFSHFVVIAPVKTNDLQPTIEDVTNGTTCTNETGNLY